MASTSSAAATLKLIKQYLKEPFAVYKSKGLSCIDTAAYVQLQLQDDLQCRLMNYGFLVCYGGVLDKESHGVMSCYIGKKTSRMKPITHGIAKYEIAVKLGTETDNLHANGVVIDEKPFSHITEGTLSTAVQKFKGQLLQIQPTEFLTNCAIYSKIFQDPHMKDQKCIPRPVRCDEVLCMSFHPPELHFQVTCGSTLDVALLMKDLGKELGTCAHVLNAKRVQHGYFTLQDALPRHQWSWKHIEEAIKLKRQNIKLQSFSK